MKRFDIFYYFSVYSVARFIICCMQLRVPRMQKINISPCIWNFPLKENVGE